MLRRSTEDYSRLSVEELLKDLGTDKDKGLSDDEVLKRLPVKIVLAIKPVTGEV